MSLAWSDTLIPRVAKWSEIVSRFGRCSQINSTTEQSFDVVYGDRQRSIYSTASGNSRYSALLPHGPADDDPAVSFVGSSTARLKAAPNRLLSLWHIRADLPSSGCETISRACCGVPRGSSVRHLSFRIKADFSEAEVRQFMNHA